MEPEKSNKTFEQKNSSIKHFCENQLGNVWNIFHLSCEIF